MKTSSGLIFSYFISPLLHCLEASLSTCVPAYLSQGLERGMLFLVCPYPSIGGDCLLPVAEMSIPKLLQSFVDVQARPGVDHDERVSQALNFVQDLVAYLDLNSSWLVLSIVATGPLLLQSLRPQFITELAQTRGAAPCSQSSCATRISHRLTTSYPSAC